MIYYLNPNRHPTDSGGSYEVHTADCHHRPEDTSRLKFLGNHPNAKAAIIAAKQHYMTLAADIDGCFFCCREENRDTKDRF